MITALTKSERESIPKIREKWLNIGLRCGNKDNPRERAFQGAIEAYKIAGRTPPKYWVWMDSPYCAVIACSVLAQVGDQVLAQVRDQVRDQVSAQVRDQVSAQVGDQVGDQVIAQVRDQVSDQVGAQVRDQVSEFANRWWWLPGQFDGFWIAFYETLKSHCDFEKLSGLSKIAENCALCYTFPDVVVFCARPEQIHRDAEHRLHNLNGPAIGFPDGWGVWAVHGVRIDKYIIEQPEKISIADIEGEKNAEIRRVKIDRYEAIRFKGAYLLDSGAVEIHRDDFGILYRKELPNDEPYLSVKVVNSTPEPDGSFKDYWIRVDAQCRPILRTDSEPGGRLLGDPQKLTAHNAVASTWGMRGEEYNPCLET